MSKNFEIIDWKPQIELVVDHKPKNELIVEYKPKNETISSSLTDQLFNMTLGAGMLVGFGPHITYPEAISIISSKSP